MKRLNLKLLIGLLIAAVVLSGGAYGVWRLQMRRNSANFLVWADEHREKGDLDKEAEFLYRYLLYDPQALDVETRYALVAAEITEKDPRRIMPAINACIKVLRQDETNNEVRQKLGELYVRLGRFSDAVSHLERVHKADPSNSDAADLLAACYIAQDNVQAAEALLLEAIEKRPEDIKLYQTLASRIYLQSMKDPAKSRELLDQMVERNPESWEAYLRRFQIVSREIDQRPSDAARADLQRAFELAPTNHEVAVAAAEQAVQDRKLEEARQILAAARTANPKLKEIFIAQSQLEQIAGQTAAAQEILRQGIQANPDDTDLLWLLADTHLRMNQPEEVRQVIKQLEGKRVALERLDFLRALALMQEKKPAEALSNLNRIRPLMANAPGFQRQIDLHRANCYRALGQIDQEIGVYRNLLLSDPIRGPKLELARALLTAGRVDEALPELREMAEQGNTTAQAMLYQTLLSQTLRTPPEQRNWAPTDQLIDILAPASSEEPRLVIMRVDYLLRKSELDAAHQLLDQHREKMSEEISFWLAEAELANRRDGYDAAMKILNDAQEKFGDKMELRTARITLLAQQGDDESKAALLAMEKDADQLPASDKDALLKTLAQILYILRDYEQSERMYEKVIALPENARDVQLLVTLFSVQRDADNSDGMERTLAKIKEVAPGGERNEYYQFCTAAKIVADVQRQRAPREQLAQAHKILEDATRDRPNWAQAWRLRGEIEERTGDTESAVASFKRALDLGDSNPMMVKHLAALLLAKGQSDQVQALMDRLPNGRAILGKRIEALVNIAQGDIADAIPAAIESVEEDPNSSHVTQVWLGDVLKSGGRFDEAEAAYRKAIDLAPDMPEGYLALANFLSSQDRRNEVNELIPQVEAKIDVEKRDLALASLHEVAGNTEETEKLLVKLLEKTPNNPALLEAAVAFFARSGQNEKAVEYIHQLAGLDTTASPEQRNAVRNANRNLANIEATKGTPEAIKNAIALVQRNATPDLDSQDLALQARFYVSLGDPKSLDEAVKLLRQALAKEPERPQERLMLARLLEQDDKWREAKDIMLSLVSSERLRDDPNVMATYADMLLRHGEVNEASTYVRRLEELKFDKHPAFVAIKARQLRDQGKTDESISLLTSQIVRPLSPEGLNQLRELGDQLVSLSQGNKDSAKYLDAAEELLREYVAERPDAKIVLAGFMGQYRNLDAGFAVCQEALKEGAPRERIVQLSLGMLRGNPEQRSEKLNSQVEEWIKQGLEADDQSVDLLLLQADYYDLIDDHARAADVYRKLKDRTDLSVVRQVTVLNNLAFIIAIRDKKGDEALPMIDEAIKLIGPLPELLDTRGMVHLSRGNTAEAIADLQSSLAAGPDAVKYFHLARAQLAANNRQAAAEAFDQARNLGLTATSAPSLERREFEQLNAEFPPKASAAN